MLQRTRRVLLTAVLLAAGLQPMTGTASAVPVAGYVYITWNAPATSPSVVRGGVFAAWTCTQTTWPTTTAFRVDCYPPALSTPSTVAAPPSWQCDWLHAASMTSSPGTSLRTTMFCDGTQVGQTATVSGPGGYDSVLALSGTNVQRVFSCVIDNGAKELPTMPMPGFLGFCGDPPSGGLLG